MLKGSKVPANQENGEAVPIGDTPSPPQDGDNLRGRGPAKRPRLHKWLVWVILLGFMLISYAPVAYGRFAHVESGISTNDSMVFVLLPALSLIAMAGSAIAARVLMRGTVSFEVHWVAQRKLWDLLGVIALPIVLFAGSAIVLCALRALSVPVASGTLFSAKPSIIFLVTHTFLMGLFAPTVEEIFWRGTIQNGLERVSNGLVAFVLQAVMFALLHLRGFGATVPVFFVGLVLGAWRWRRKTFLPLIVAHMAVNSVVCAVLWRDYLELQRIRITTDYSPLLRELTRPVDFTMEQDAWSHYKRAFELFVEIPKGLSEADCRQWPTEVAPKKLTLLRSWIRSNEQSIAKFEFATQMPYLCPDYDRLARPGISFPEVQKVKPMMLAMHARAQISAMLGDGGQSVSDIITCYRFGRHFSGPKPLLDQIMGLAVKGSTLRVAFGILQRAALDETSLKKLQVELEGMSEKGIAPIDFSGEELILYDQIQRAFTDDGMGRGRIPRASVQQLKNPPPYMRALGIPWGDQEPIGSWLRLERRETTRLAGEIFAYLESIELASPAELRRMGKDVPQDIRRMARGNAFLFLLTKTFGINYHRAQRCEAFKRALILTVAIFRYKLDKGDLPSELSDLVLAGYVEVLPLDPYSDAPFVYKKGVDDFLLYSLGPDFKDDGGSRGDTGRIAGGDDVFWPHEEN